MHPMELKKLVLVVLISCCILVIILFWHQTNEKPTLIIPQIVMHTVRKIYPVREKKGEPRWTWKCLQQRCERHHYNPSTDKLTSLATCGMLCGSTQLWPQPTGTITLGSKIVNFLHQQIHFETSADEPARSLLETSYAIFNENVAALIRQPDYWMQKTELDRITIKVKVLHSKQVHLFLNTDESYNLTVKTEVIKLLPEKRERPPKAINELSVSILAPTFFGARHALETLSQLIWWDEYATEKGGMLCTLRTATIGDKPAFSYRGLMIDTARNFMPISDLERVVDGMSSTKLNVFHWHISDSQSFPLKLPSVPQLALHGAYSSEMTYTPEEVRNFVEYSRVRGIRVIIEVDTPAHAGNGWQWGPQEGLGNLAVCINARPWSLYCGEPPCGQLNPENPHVYDLLEKIYGDLLDMGTDTEIFHLGGDEVNLECWAQNILLDKKSTVSNYTDLHDLWGGFTVKALRRLEKANGNSKRRISDKLKNVIVWSSNLSRRPYLQKYFDRDKIVVQSWGSSQWMDTQDLLADGYRVLISHVDAWYLDCGFGRWRETGDAACDPYRPWQTMYSHRPWVQLQHTVNTQILQQNPATSTAAKPVDVKKQIMGGEVCLWTEQLDSNSLDTRLWPRTAAFGERMWSDPVGTPLFGQPAPDSLDPYLINEDSAVPEDVYTRLVTHRNRLTKRGIGAEPLWPRWCSHNPGMCL